jgi:hypothetical protein
MSRPVKAPSSLAHSKENSRQEYLSSFLLNPHAKEKGLSWDRWYAARPFPCRAL